ncbi:hypothetical protein AGRA3207_003226 [Actinomadura graeca]|uniref:Uncharacterized protein n=1 Tax=Actinomadura graeca TaxID=2750812 RepID=A0ABX8QWZ5_9ACTN|nr:DUF6182 family protein [Actinomadura graeca]QXJ22252.1 hypothetical protein AGRA3207_003226 [Actinomadura graeca]
MFDQQTLREVLGGRVARARDAWPSGDAGIGAVAVLRDFTPAGFAGSAVAFAGRLSPRERALWYGSFTRTVFLAGDPRNLAERFRPAHVSEDGAIAWYGPGPLAEHATLRRLLRPVRGTTDPGWAGALHVALSEAQPTSGKVARLRVAVRDMTLPDYLVHVNHTLAEAVLDGLLTAADVLEIEHVPHLPDDPGPYEALRVSSDPLRPGSLRAYAALSLDTAP